MTDTPACAPIRSGDRLVRGAGRYTADIAVPGCLHIAFLRSPVAAGKITELDTGPVTETPGIHAVFTGADVAALGRLPVNTVLPLPQPPGFPILASDYLEAIGQPIAAVVADTFMHALEYTEQVDLDIEERPAPPANPIATKAWQTGDPQGARANAAHVTRVRVTHPLLAPSPMEPRAFTAASDGTSLTIWQSTQTPHRTRAHLAEILQMDPGSIRVIAPDVGGAFGMKGSLYPEEVMVAFAALRLGRPVRWTATRSEEFLSATHGRGVEAEGWLALDKDGHFLGIGAEVHTPLGHWLPNSGLITAWNAARIIPSGYRVGTVDVTTTAALTNRPPRGIYRGAGRPEANTLVERLIDQAARETGTDPLALRLANLLSSGDLPHDTATGNRLDSGDYAAALTALPYVTACARRDAARAQGGLAGLGLAFYLEPSGEGWESAAVTLNADGTAHVASGSSDQGQSRARAYAAIAAEALEKEPGQITVSFGDTGTDPDGIGALASRSTPIGGSAVLTAARAAKARVEAGEALPLTEETRYTTQGQAWGYGAYLAEVQIDPETGELTITQLTAVDDAGRIVDAALVEGQVRGGIAQGIGEATCEALRFDPDGQLLTGSFMDYAMPRAQDMPPVTLHTMETPSPLNALGAKGVGEAGTIGAPPAILNAALDALAPLGVTDLTMPLTPYTLWQAMEDARR